jgi:sulfite reductase (ferredoxin)
MKNPLEPSGVEKIKEASNYLRGTIAEELANGSEAFEEDTVQLLKHHGMYQQDDRDRRGAKDAQGIKLGKAYSLMVRVKVPGGRMTAEQLLAQLDLCDQLGSGTARITDRQDIQLHGVLKKNVRQAVRRINEVQLTTLGACGDVERNVMCCPAPFRRDPVRVEIQEMASRLSSHLLPRSTAYHEIWLSDPETGEKRLCGGGSEGHEIEPLYGANYLPRKFKTAIGLADDNCVDAYGNDLGLLAIREGSQLLGYNVLVGGGFGVTPSNKRTFPAVAKRMAFAKPDEVVALATAIIGVQRDLGDRSDRKRARMKYLIADWGVDRFKAKVEEYYGRGLAEPHPQEVHGFDDHLGWFEQGDGRWFYGLNVENGRILDREGFRLKSALAEICRSYRPGIALTPHQSILFTDLRPEDRSGLESVLRHCGVKLSEEISNVRRWSMACVALPTCPLAVTESERVLPGLMDKLEGELQRIGLEGERFTVRMTGCPNGCSRPYNADIGLVGKTAGKYTIYLGGRLLGDRQAFLFKDLVRLEDLVTTLLPVLLGYKAQRLDGETLGDYCNRMGAEGLHALAAGTAG